MKYRTGRVEGEILRELTKTLRRDIHNPRLSDITITVVERTNDLSYVTIYYSLLTGDPAKEKEVTEGLDKVKGMIRHLLGQTSTVYKVPELIFKRDTSVAYDPKVGNLIDQVKKQD